MTNGNSNNIMGSLGTGIVGSSAAVTVMNSTIPQSQVGNAIVGLANRTPAVTTAMNTGMSNQPQTANSAAGQQTSSLLSNIERANFKDSIMIHVIDDSKNEKRDFTFSRSLLVKYMKYFDKCLKKISNDDEIDISIHCDAVIFEWLLNYIFSMEEYEKKQQKPGALGQNTNNSNWQLTVQKCNDSTDPKKSAIQQYNGPKLDIKNAVTILISADFLKIDRLVKECLEFFVEHIEEISKVQVDMGCINSQIIRDMARKVSLDRLNVLKERKDKLVSRLFMKKLELLLEKERNYLYKCAYCNKLFTMSQRKVLHCAKARSYIDCNGEIRQKHVIDKSWDLKKFVTHVRETYRISWREIYWKVWSFLYVFRCERCSVFHHISELGNCRVHKQPPKVKMSLQGPMGSNYQFGCCDKEVNVTAILSQNMEQLLGCESLVHEVSETYQLDQSKEKKITDRVIAHQLIILEKASIRCIEKIVIREFNEGQINPKESTIKLCDEGSQQPQNIVRPSSLNYKISLCEAVEDFIKKDMPISDDQFIDVIPEEPRTPNTGAANTNKNPHGSTTGEPHEDFDDLMFDMTYNNNKQTNQVNKNAKAQPTTPLIGATNATTYVAENGQAKDAWFREEELMRRKLEKGAINQLKSRIAQANRQAGNKNAIDVNNDGNDSDLDPSETKGDDGAGVQGAVNPTQVQLNPQQVEEAKQMTYGKLKQFRRDRLYASDRDRQAYLIDMLKKNRVTDDQQNYAHFFGPSVGLSPNKANQNKNQEQKQANNLNTTKPSPTKIPVSTTKQTETQHNGQVMTQISAIYAKRSRSILNQFGQTNIGANAHPQAQVVPPTNNANAVSNTTGAHNTATSGQAGPTQSSISNTTTQNPLHLSPNQNINQGRGSVGNTTGQTNTANDQHDSKGSPRLGRLRGISPQSREKGYMTGTTGVAAQGTTQTFSQSAQNVVTNVSMLSASGGMAVHSNFPSNQSGQNNMSQQQVGASNLSNLSNMIHQNTSTSFSQPASAETQNSHNPNDRVAHSSPNKGPLSSSFGMAGSVQNAAISMVGSTAGSIQQGSVGGISGIGGISGMSGGGARPGMNQTTNGKSFPYTMHRKTNSNKLPHIGSSNGKDSTAQSIQQPGSSQNIYNGQ